MFANRNRPDRIYDLYFIVYKIYTRNENNNQQLLLFDIAERANFLLYIYIFFNSSKYVSIVKVFDVHIKQNIP